jgi:hypothetical protein
VQMVVLSKAKPKVGWYETLAWYGGYCPLKNA